MSVPAADLFSEKFGAMGNVVAEGVWNQLGRPELDRLTLLIRESVQNSWDARLGATIRFKIDAFSLTPAQLRAYGQFFENQPPADAYTASSTLGEPIHSLAAWLGAPGPRMLVISDRDTRGLDGPTRADDTATDGDKRNFVDFLRNVGQPPDAGRRHTGGTFGYGKAALYLASETRTILVHTRCIHGGKLESRLTAASLSHNYAHERSRYTGRHWWGVLTDGSVIEPFVGAAADETAAALGLPPFDGDESGTSIGITAPAFDDGELYEVGKICLRHLWPKLKAPNQERPPISLSAKISGVGVPMPDPAKTPPYDAYWRAYCALHEKQHADIKYKSETVGRLCLERALMLTAPERTSTTPVHEQRPQHIALLRSPELVVKYLDAGRGLGNDKVGFVGVFKADEGFDDSFARSEPPTHDDWQPSSVSDKRARGIVNTALKRIREHSQRFAEQNSPRVTGAEGSPLALLAREFAVLAPGVRLGGTNERERPISSQPSSGRRERKPRPQVHMAAEQNSTVEEVEGVVYAVFLVDITHASGSETTNVTAQVYSVLSGGALETDSPFGKPPLRIGWWESPRGARVDGNPLRIGPRQQGCWKLFVPIEDNVAVAVEIDAQPEQAS